MSVRSTQAFVNMAGHFLMILIVEILLDYILKRLHILHIVLFQPQRRFSLFNSKKAVYVNERGSRKFRGDVERGAKVCLQYVFKEEQGRLNRCFGRDYFEVLEMSTQVLNWASKLSTLSLIFIPAIFLPIIFYYSVKHYFEIFTMTSILKFVLSFNTMPEAQRQGLLQATIFDLKSTTLLSARAIWHYLEHFSLPCWFIVTQTSNTLQWEPKKLNHSLYYLCT